MTVKILRHDEHRSIRIAFRRKPAGCDGFNALEKTDIDELSATAINNMTCDELVRMIHVANLPTLRRSDLDQHLPFFDRTVLIPLAHLAKRCCRNHGTRSLGEDAAWLRHRNKIRGRGMRKAAMRQLLPQAHICADQRNRNR